jgi:peptidoglycan/xylan/chitin deacetylase (PgdA/CDA1 family)
MRIDRAVTLLAFRTIGTLGVPHAGARLPVLMYHSISAAPEATTPYYRIATHPVVFEDHMRILASAGYRGVTLSDGLKSFRQSSLDDMGRQPVALTFDDGYRDFLTDAVPVLERYGFKATMYLPTGFIGDRRRQFKDRECLTWREVIELHERGFEFGSHTVTHPRLVDLTFSEIEHELVVSKRTIETNLQSEVTAFAYPYAFPQQKRTFTAKFRDLAEASGYFTSVTTIIGHVSPQDDALCLKRLPVNSDDDAELFRAKLEGFYNWMAAPQAAAKQVRLLALR